MRRIAAVRVGMYEDGRTEVQRSVGRRKADADQEAAGYRRGARGRQ